MSRIWIDRKNQWVMSEFDPLLESLITTFALLLPTLPTVLIWLYDNVVCNKLTVNTQQPVMGAEYIALHAVSSHAAGRQRGKETKPYVDVEPYRHRMAWIVSTDRNYTLTHSSVLPYLQLPECFIIRICELFLMTH